ncbi:MAG: hypothetical protein HOP00_04700 [Nitrospira sp.]|nr:hypothetical protein [Nitrospira sp.]
MENLAFTTLIILLLAVPGYVYRTIYFSEDFSKEVVPKSVTEEVYLSILFSLPFHATAYLVLDKLYTSSVTNLYIDLNMVFGALTGQYAEDLTTGRTSLADNVYRYFLAIIWYLLAVAAAAASVGRLFRWLVWNFKLDVKVPSLFRYRNRWLYTFTGRELERRTGEYHHVVLDAMCSLVGDKTRLYRGVVVGFDTNIDGDLEQIRLGLAYRGKFREPSGEFYWQEIPGHILVLKYDSVQSLNVTKIAESEFSGSSPSFRQSLDQPIPMPDAEPAPSHAPPPSAPSPDPS